MAPTPPDIEARRRVVLRLLREGRIGPDARPPRRPGAPTDPPEHVERGPNVRTRAG